jgi:endonuclease-3
MSTPSSKAAAPNKRRPSTPKKQLVPNPNPDPALVSKALKIAAQLQQLYPEPAIPLDHASPFQLLVAVMLSAQTTDKKVGQLGVVLALVVQHDERPSCPLALGE